MITWLWAHASVAISKTREALTTESSRNAILVASGAWASFIVLVIAGDVAVIGLLALGWWIVDGFSTPPILDPSLSGSSMVVDVIVIIGPWGEVMGAAATILAIPYVRRAVIPRLRSMTSRPRLAAIGSGVVAGPVTLGLVELAGWGLRVTGVVGASGTSSSAETRSVVRMVRSIDTGDVGMMMLTVLGILAFAVIVPVLEEVVFRVGIQGSMTSMASTRRGRVLAVVISAVLFSAAHVVSSMGWDASLALSTLLLGLVLGFVQERSGSAWPAVIGHIVYNTMVIVIASLILV